MNINGVIFYEGKSRIDGKPIVGIATFNSRNEKTGNLVQTWIIRSDIPPVNAVHQGEDKSICGNCPLRGFIDKDGTNRERACYVLVHQAPYQIYESYKRGNYPKLSPEHAPYMDGSGLRYGSYGDPVAIPLQYWKELRQYCTGKATTGYTHQWKIKRFSAWSKYVMASTHTTAENELAASNGWRTFRTINLVTEKEHNEIVCPASAEAGFKSTCEKCGLCNGKKENDPRKSIVIVGHGHHKPKLIERVIQNAQSRD